MTLKDDILALRAEGYNYKQIKAELSCSLGTISYYCSPVQKDRTMQRQRDRRNKNRKFIQEYKQANPCVDCGENYPYYVMDFDHLRDKSFGIGSMAPALTREALKEEIEKCELVCANCHRFRTHTRSITNGGYALEFKIE